MQPNNNNLVAEIGLIAISVTIIIGAIVLLILGNINYVELAGMLGVVLALWGANSLYKAPSPSQQVQIGTQQSQLNAQQANLQQLFSYALSMLPQLVQSLQAQPVPAQVLQTAQPTPMPVQPPVAQPAQLSIIQPEVSSGEGTQSPVAPPQFKAPVAQPAIEHPPIDPKDMVNTFPNIPAFVQPQKQ
jgi:hypothetical protein